MGRGKEYGGGGEAGRGKENSLNSGTRKKISSPLSCLFFAYIREIQREILTTMFFLPPSEITVGRRRNLIGLIVVAAAAELKKKYYFLFFEEAKSHFYHCWQKCCSSGCWKKEKNRFLSGTKGERKIFSERCQALRPFWAPLLLSSPAEAVLLFSLPSFNEP